MLSPDVPALVSRGVLAFLATEAVTTLSKSTKNEDKEALREVAEYALEKGTGHAQVFEDADVTFREFLFDFLKAEGCYKEAATVLAGQCLLILPLIPSTLLPSILFTRFSIL